MSNQRNVLRKHLRNNSCTCDRPINLVLYSECRYKQYLPSQCLYLEKFSWFLSASIFSVVTVILVHPFILQGLAPTLGKCSQWRKSTWKQTWLSRKKMWLLLSSSCLSSCCSLNYFIWPAVTCGNFQSQFRVIVLLSPTNWSMT